MQTARGNDPFCSVARFPQSGNGCEVYATLRTAIPVIDAAICKIVRLVGGFKIKCSDNVAKKLLEDFLKNVPYGVVSVGIDSFVAGTLDRLLTYGTAVNELVFDSDGRLAALYGASLDSVELSVGKNPLKPQIFHRGGEPLSHPERIIVTALAPEPDSPYGNSLLKSLPFVSGILLKIYSCVGVNFERMGNLRFAVTYRPSGIETGIGDSRAQEIASAWSEAMRDTEMVRDFIAVGDVDIKVIGAEAAMPDIEVPIRAMLEQIIAKTGLPPFMLGFSWSSTERMSVQQADMLTSELEYYRTLLTPVIIKICRAFLRGEGYFCDVAVEWDNISLQDETEIAKARLYNAQAEKIENGEEV